jgi:hypothetical protein
MMYQYGPSFSPRWSSRPAHLTAPNGLNLSKSVGNPSSRLEKMLKYLAENGPSTKREILTKCFNKTVNDDPTVTWGNGTVRRGWGVYLFVLAIRNGYITKTRTGNTVKYSLA